MPAYSFQKQFVPPVESGDKLHTIRGKRKNRPRVGQKFYGYYAMRTKQCRKIVESVITRVQDIEIWADLAIKVDGEWLARDEREILAIADGFASREEMMKFWDGRLPFHGDIIHWRRVDA